MSDTERRKQLLQVLALIDQQMAEADSLAAELPDGSADWQGAIEWKEELIAARAETNRKLGEL